jgi:hypothetical protein
LEESSQIKESSSSDDLKWEKDYSQSNQSTEKGHSAIGARQLKSTGEYISSAG